MEESASPAASIDASRYLCASSREKLEDIYVRSLAPKERKSTSSAIGPTLLRLEVAPSSRRTCNLSILTARQRPSLRSHPQARTSREPRSGRQQGGSQYPYAIWRRIPGLCSRWRSTQMRRVRVQDFQGSSPETYFRITAISRSFRHLGQVTVGCTVSME